VLFDVLPVHTPDEHADGRWRYAKRAGQLDLTYPVDVMCLSDLTYEFGSELRTSVIIAPQDAFRMAPSEVIVAPPEIAGIGSSLMSITFADAALLKGVSWIGGLGAQPQMPTALVLDPVNNMNADVVIPDASGIVPIRAVVTDELIGGRPYSGSQPPRNTVHSLDLPAATGIRNSHLPVPEQMVTAGGEPATVRLHNSLPESDGDWQAAALGIASLRAVGPLIAGEAKYVGPANRTGCSDATLVRHVVSPERCVAPSDVPPSRGLSRAWILP
jgi:hypothetical protein